MKIRQENDVIHHIGAIYTKNKAKLSWPIKLSVIYDEN